MSSKLAQVSKSKIALAGAAAVAAAAVIGTTVGYASIGKQVTLNVDGKVQHVSATGDTVGDVLHDQGISLNRHDEVAPSIDQPVNDGTTIAVRYGKPLKLDVNGDTTTYWVTATDVRGALHEIDRSFDRARLSVSRGAGITRDGLRITVATPRRLTFVIGGHRAVHKTVPAYTVAQALKEMHLTLGKHDVVRPGLHHRLHAGDKVVLDRVRVVRKHVSGEAVPFSTISHDDSSMLQGHSTVVRPGHDGLRNVTYRITFRNGHLVTRQVLSQHVLREAVAQIERVGTKTVATTNFASGSTVWDQLAQCESGGNWAADTGNGYYGGLQFSLGTWQANGGSGLPSNASRTTQIAIATKIRNASGGYGAWPACSASLGLPQ
ncbi:MAG TPA: transglycosylase family protein [Nocardioides sp.]|nr:transglycosylase family protein [Nocardioides sp.]